MNKTFTLFALLFSFYINAQSIIPDTTFGTNGIYSYTNQTNGNSIIKSLVQPDGKIIISGLRINGGSNDETFVSRLNADGTLDTTFAVNGFYTAYQNNFTYFSNLYYVNNKILIFYPEQGVLIKLNSDGTPDNSFGTTGIMNFGQQNFGGETVLVGNTIYATQPNSLYSIDIVSGTATSNNITSVANINNVYLGPNGNLLLRSINETTFTTYLSLVNTSGVLDTSFGVNGTITVHVSPTENDFNQTYDYVSIDSSNNIYYAFSNDATLTSNIKKFDLMGNNIMTFGSSGNYQFTNNIISDLKIFSDQVYLSGANVNGANINLFLARINSNGTLDNTFDNDGIFIYDTNSLNEWAENMNIISPTTVIVAGEYSSGLNNNIYAGKFLVTPNLSTSEFNTTNTIWFENPLKSNLVYKSTEVINSFEIYSMDGKLVSTLNNNNTGVSELSKGIYFVKIKFQNGKIISKKLIKE